MHTCTYMHVQCTCILTHNYMHGSITATLVTNSFTRPSCDAHPGTEDIKSSGRDHPQILCLHTAVAGHSPYMTKNKPIHVGTCTHVHVHKVVHHITSNYGTSKPTVYVSSNIRVHTCTYMYYMYMYLANYMSTQLQRSQKNSCQHFHLSYMYMYMYSSFTSTSKLHVNVEYGMIGYGRSVF